jgi:hypothetical protein
MMFDRDYFFAHVRLALFHKMTEAQVAGCNAILATCEANHLIVNKAWVAYILATAFHETGKKMQPVREIGEGHGHAYGVPDPVTHKVYYGRGLVQLTWKANYAKFEKIVGADLVGNPDLALDPAISAKILISGMIAGSFTGVGLAHYFPGPGADWTNARRIINGTDHSTLIAGYGLSFNAALIPAKAPAAATA